MPPPPPIPRSADKFDAIHRSLLSGLLSNIGHKGEQNEYTAPRGHKFHIFPGSTLFKRRPDWLMAAELVETTRLYARTTAKIDPRWIERLAPHLIKRSYSDPHYNRQQAKVLASEKVSLYGLVLIPARTINYGPIDPATSRELFIHHALVEGEYPTYHPFLKHNLTMVADIKKLEAKTRRRDLLADQRARFGFYAHRLPQDVFDGRSFELWFREASAEHRKSEISNSKSEIRQSAIGIQHSQFLFMTEADLFAAAADVPRDAFPDTLDIAGKKFPLEYRYDTGSPFDGITLTVPVEVLSALPGHRLDYLVPGYVEEKIVTLLRTLPKTLRTQFVPANDYAKPAAAQLKPADIPLTHALANYLTTHTPTAVPRDAFAIEELPPHLVMTIKVIDAGGKTLKTGKNITQLRTDLGLRARETFADLPRGDWNRDGLLTWDFPDLPDRNDIELNGLKLPAYPGIIDQGNTVGLRLFEASEPSRLATRAGLRKLFMLQLKKEIEYLERHVPGIEQVCIHYATVGSCESLQKDIVSAASDRAFYDPTDSIRTRADYIDRGRDAWRRLSAATTEIARYVADSLAPYHDAQLKLNRTLPTLLAPSASDVKQQLANLVYPGFASRTPHRWLQHLPRFVNAADVRLKKLFNAGAARDSINLALIRPLWDQYLRRRDLQKKQNIYDPELTEYRWMLEEFRVSLFAQELKTSMPISPQRLESQWMKVRAV